MANGFQFYIVTDYTLLLLDKISDDGGREEMSLVNGCAVSLGNLLLIDGPTLLIPPVMFGRTFGGGLICPPRRRRQTNSEYRFGSHLCCSAAAAIPITLGTARARTSGSMFDMSNIMIQYYENFPCPRRRAGIHALGAHASICHAHGVLLKRARLRGGPKV